MTSYEPGPLDKHFKALLHTVVDAAEMLDYDHSERVIAAFFRS
jgi:hypothetical protein